MFGEVAEASLALKNQVATESLTNLAQLIKTKRANMMIFLARLNEVKQMRNIIITIVDRS